MSIRISAIKPTTLKSNLASDATQVQVKQFLSRDGNAVTWAQLDTDWLVIVVKQADVWEQIKCDGLTQNPDGSATLDIATDGRHILPIPPYSGSSTGFDFSIAEVIVSNDVLTSNSIIPQGVYDYIDGEVIDIQADITAIGNEVDAIDATAVHKTGNETVGGVKTFSSSPKAPSPTTGDEVATRAYVLGIAFGGVYDGFNNATITRDSAGRVATIIDNDLLKTFTLGYDSEDNITSVTDGTTTWTLVWVDGDLVSITS